MKNSSKEKLLLLVLAVGILIIIGSLTSSSYTVGDKIWGCFLGGFLCLFATIDTFRWAVAALFFLLLTIAGIPNLINTDGSFSFTGLILVVAFGFAGAYFVKKALRQFRFIRSSNVDLSQIDRMTGLEFEHYTAGLLMKLGYSNVQVTKASGDQGIDVLASKDGVKYAIQCKNYSNKLSNTAVQEAFAGKSYYGCDVAVVITNSTFTAGAKELANSTGVLLWDRQTLQKMIAQTNQRAGDRVTISENTSQPILNEKDAPSQERIPTDRYAENFKYGVKDYMVPAAVDAILEHNAASVSTLQRRLHLAYTRADSIMDELEEKEIVGPFAGSNPRTILITPAQWEYIREKIPTNIVPDITNEQWAAMRSWYSDTDFQK